MNSFHEWTRKKFSFQLLQKELWRLPSPCSSPSHTRAGFSLPPCPLISRPVPGCSSTSKGLACTWTSWDSSPLQGQVQHLKEAYFLLAKFHSFLGTPRQPMSLERCRTPLQGATQAVRSSWLLPGTLSFVSQTRAAPAASPAARNSAAEGWASHV